MKHSDRPLQFLALSAACLFAAPPAWAGASVPEPLAPPVLPVQPVQDGTALADFIDAPEVYFELYDLGAFERDVRTTGLGRLSTQLVPFIEQIVEQAELPEDAQQFLAGTLMPVLGGDLTWEDGIAATAADLLEFKLGLSAGDAVTVAAALGNRISFAMDMDFAQADHNEHWAMALALRPGGDLALTDILLPRLAEQAGQKLDVINVHMERDATGVYGAWTVDEGLVVIRPGLLAMTSDRGTADRLLLGSASSATSNGGRRPVVTQFQMKRNDSMRRSERAWLFMSGDLSAVKLEQSSNHERAVSQALGLDVMGDFELSLSAQKGQLVSRMMLEKRGAGGLLGLARGRAAKWDSMRLLTADALLVVGIPQSPSVVVDDLVAMIAQAEASAGGSDLEEVCMIAASNPILTALGERGAFASETLLFVRPGAAGIPMVYIVAEAAPSLEQALAGLDQYESEGGILNVRSKQIDDQPAWLISSADMGKQWGLALMRREGGGVVASYSLLGLQAYARQRTRERVEDREALIAGVRADLATGMGSGTADRVAAFAHVRVEPLAEWVWPMALMGLSMSGTPGLEELPDAIELAEQIGDTTLILYDYDDRIELWGRGLLGGLGFIF